MRRAMAAAAMVLVSLVLLPLPAAVEEGTLEVGFGERNITPKVDPKGKPVYLAGFGNNRKATGILDPLFVRAFVVRDGKSKVAIVSADLVGLFLDTVERVREKLPGFTYVVVSSTHSHDGPDTMGIWGPSPLVNGIDKEYLASVEQKIVEAVKEADAGKQPVKATIGSVKAPELLHDSRLPIVLHDDLVVLSFKEAKSDKNAGLVVQWNNHPEILGGSNKLISSDYVGYTVQYLKEKYSCPVVYLTGTVGGLMTSLHVPIKSAKGEELKDGTAEKTARYGELLGMRAVEAIDAAKPVKLTPIETRSSGVYVPLTNRNFLLAHQLGVLKRDAFEWNADPKKIVPLKGIIDLKKPVAMKTEVGYVKFGELEIACIPGEIYPELVLDKVVEKAEPGVDFPDAPREPAIYNQLKGPHRMIIGLANDEIGYIIPKRQWDEKPPFAYGKEKGQYGEVNSLGPDTAPIICQAFADLLSGKK